MPPRKTPARRTTKSAKTPARRASKSKALAISDPVKREALRRSVLDSQFAVLEAIMAWSPARLLVNQQAAFWEGFSAPSAAPRTGASKRKRRAKST
jgi:hypothetical protein